MTSPQPSRIVLIEDNPGDIFLLRHALAAYGDQYQIEVLDDGKKALDYVCRHCQSNGTGPCVLVLDLHLPIFDGLQVLQAIRQEPELDGLRIVAITGFASRQEETAVRNLGVQLYRNKPNELSGFQKLAEEIIAVCNEHSSVTAV